MSLQTDLLNALAEFHSSIGSIVETHATENDAPTDPEAPVWRPGFVLTEADHIPLIPAGTVLKDKDGDRWFRHDTGRLNLSPEEDNYDFVFSLADYLPATVVSVRPTPETARVVVADEPLADCERELLATTPATPEPIAQLGDRVTVVKVSAPIVAWREKQDGKVIKTYPDGTVRVAFDDGGEVDAR